MNTPLSAFGVARNSSLSMKSFGNSLRGPELRESSGPPGGVVTISRPFFARSGRRCSAVLVRRSLRSVRFDRESPSR